MIHSQPSALFLFQCSALCWWMDRLGEKWRTGIKKKTNVKAVLKKKKTLHQCGMCECVKMLADFFVVSWPSELSSSSLNPKDLSDQWTLISTLTVILPNLAYLHNYVSEHKNPLQPQNLYFSKMRTELMTSLFFFFFFLVIYAKDYWTVN